MDCDVWERPLFGNRLAIAIMYKQELGGPRRFPISAVPGWKICAPQCNVTQILPQYKELGVQSHQKELVLSVNPTGTTLLTVTPLSGDLRKQHWNDTSAQKKHIVL